MILKLTRNTHPIWKQKFKNITKATSEIQKKIADMKETLDLTGGVGLAAPQVGLPLNLFIIKYGKLDEVFVNPRIVKYGEEKDEVEEGCLSLPCVRGNTPRSLQIEIEYQDLKGGTKLAQLSGYYARIAQHEYDHLSSTFYLNRIDDKEKIYTYEPAKIVFFGTPEFGVTNLKTLVGQRLAGEYEIPLVVTAADKPSGRGREIKKSPVKEYAEKFELEVFEGSMKDLLPKLKKIAPHFLVVASFGQILPKEILATAKNAPLNVHPSLLPQYRGASPIQASILNGEEHTGVTIIKMNEKMDAGPILASAKVRIKGSETAENLSEKLADIGSLLLNQVIHILTTGKIKPKPQEEEEASYTKILTKEDGYIDWKKPPKNLEAMIRAYHPWPGVWTRYNNKILKLLSGKKVQLEGKEPIGLKEFKQGHQDFNLEW